MIRVLDHISQMDMFSFIHASKGHDDILVIEGQPGLDHIPRLTWTQTFGHILSTAMTKNPFAGGPP